MEKIATYSTLICKVLQSHDFRNSRVRTLFIADKEKHHYQLLTIGLDSRNAYYVWVSIHIELRADGKVWILENHTEHNIADELIAEGISASDVVLGTLPENVRAYTGFAVK